MAMTNGEKQKAYRLRKARREAVERGDVSRVMVIDRLLRGDVDTVVRIERAVVELTAFEARRLELEGVAREEVRSERHRQLHNPAGIDFGAVVDLERATAERVERTLGEEFPLDISA